MQCFKPGDKMLQLLSLSACIKSAFQPEFVSEFESEQLVLAELSPYRVNGSRKWAHVALHCKLELYILQKKVSLTLLLSFDDEYFDA